MPTNNSAPTFSSTYPFDVTLKNHSFGNDDVSLLYITNKINETSAFQKLKVSIIQQALGEYTFNGFDFKAPSTIDGYVPATSINTPTLAPANSIFKPDSSQYNLGIVIKKGVLEEKVLLSFSNTIYTALQKSLPSDTDVAVQGPFISSSNNTLTWYCAFSKNIVTSKSSEWKAVSSSLSMVNISKTADGKLFAIGTDHNFYTCDLNTGTAWTKVNTTSNWQALSGIATANGHVWLIGLDHNLYNAGGINSQYKLMPGCGDTTFLAGMADNSLLAINTSGNLLHMPIGATTWQIIDKTTPLKSLFMGANNVIYGIGNDGITYQRSSLQDVWKKLTTVPDVINDQYKVGAIQYAVNNAKNTLVYKTTEDINPCLNFELDGVSAAPESGSRSTQIEFLFGGVSIGTNSEKFAFKRLVSLDILNHQGQSYAPLQFGVVGDGELLINDGPQNLNLYFKSFQNQVLTFNADTIISFTFPCTEGNTELVAFAEQSEAHHYMLTPNADANFEVQPYQSAGVIQAKYTKATLATPLELNFDIFKFSEIQLSKSSGLAVIEVTVQNLPGYWDSTFQIPIKKTTNSTCHQLELPTSNNNGRSGSDGSRIDFLSEGKDKNQHYNLTIEADNGLNLYGTQPNAASGARGVPTSVSEKTSGLPIRVKETDLLIPEGRVAINSGDNYPKPETGDTNKNEKLSVIGDTYLDGHLGITGDVGIAGATTLSGTTTINGKLNLEEPATLTYSGSGAALQIPYNTKPNSMGILITNTPAETSPWAPLTIVIPDGVTTPWPVVVAKEKNIIFGIDTEGNVRPNSLITKEGATINGDLNAKGGLTVTGSTTINDGFFAKKGILITGALTNIQNGLSVVGTATNDNLNVSGKLGIGITSPFSSLHICNGAVAPTPTGNMTGGLVVSNGTGGGSINIGAGWIESAYVNNAQVPLPLTLQPKGGNVGIGVSNPCVPLHVQSTQSLTIGAYNSLAAPGSSSGSTTSGSINENVSIKAEGFLIANSVLAVSDQRIKTALKPSINKDDLSKLLSIQITDYQYVDQIKQGNKTTKGVIAQELESVFPNAVNRSTGFIPNIYAAANNIEVSEAKKELTCTLGKKHELVVGDLVKLITESNTELQKEVINIIDENTFVVKDWIEAAENIFVFGKQVDDFRTVDYQQVAMLGISAMQALHQDVQTLKKENQSLKEQLQGEIKSLRAEMDALKTSSLN